MSLRVYSNRFLMLRNHMGIVVPRAFHSCWKLFAFDQILLDVCMRISIYFELLSIYLSIYLSQSIHIDIYSCSNLSLSIQFYLSIYLWVICIICLLISIYQFIYLSVFLSIYFHFLTSHIDYSTFIFLNKSSLFKTKIFTRIRSKDVTNECQQNEL